MAFWLVLLSDGLRRLVCRVFGHVDGLRGEGHKGSVLIRAYAMDGNITREREVPGVTYAICCLRCGEVLRGEVVLLDSVTM